MSGANQYSVKPFALASTLAPPICTTFRPPLDATVLVLPAVPAATPSSTSATTETPAISTPGTGMASTSRSSGEAPAARSAPGATTMTASTANAATSMIPATIPAVVRTSVNPNRPTQIDSR